jgi:hypothetical protein
MALEPLIILALREAVLTVFQAPIQPLKLWILRTVSLAKLVTSVWARQTDRILHSCSTMQGTSARRITTVPSARGLRKNARKDIDPNQVQSRQMIVKEKVQVGGILPLG